MRPARHGVARLRRQQRAAALVRRQRRQPARPLRALGLGGGMLRLWRWRADAGAGRVGARVLGGGLRGARLRGLCRRRGRALYMQRARGGSGRCLGLCSRRSRRRRRLRGRHAGRRVLPEGAVQPREACALQAGRIGSAA